MAAAWAGYDWQSYLALPGNPDAMTAEHTDCKAWVLASYRITRALEEMSSEVTIGGK